MFLSSGIEFWFVYSTQNKRGNAEKKNLLKIYFENGGSLAVTLGHSKAGILSKAKLTKGLKMLSRETLTCLFSSVK